MDNALNLEINKESIKRNIGDEINWQENNWKGVYDEEDATRETARLL